MYPHNYVCSFSPKVEINCFMIRNNNDNKEGQWES